ncbi:MAG: HAMP domain-containing protein [Deltaproteobacteria bacterium]|nr:HAMP domain-containing protein [Deltaproteobacteria bacterium]
MRTSLTIRIFVGFIAIVIVFGSTSQYAVFRMDSIRRDLQLTSQGYLELTRALAQIKAIAESRDAYVERALAEADPRVRQYLVRYARDFYPRVLRERLGELAASARRLAGSDLTATDSRFASDIADRLEHALELNRTAETAASEFFDQAFEASVPAEIVARQKESSAALGREIRLVALNLDNRIAQGVRRAEQQERNAVWVLLLLSLLALLVGLAVTLLMTRALRPLRTVTEGARAISRGGFDVRVPPSGSDEIATLANAFNDMAQALKDREAALARRSVEFESFNTFLENVLDSVATGVIVCNRALEITVSNRAARRLLGYALIDPAGKLLDSTPLQQLLAGHMAGLRAVLDDGPPLQIENQSLKVAQNPALLVDVRVLPFKQVGAPSNIAGLVVLLDDVTERERTRDRLLQSERLAAMGRLAAQVAHEIRNPLSSIGLNCELLADDVAAVKQQNPEVQRLLGAISQEIDRLTELTDGYLRYARLPDATKRVADLGPVVTDVADFVRPDFERRGLHLDVDVPAQLPRLMIDPSQVRLALLNLLRNAADATGTGHTVTMSVQALDRSVQIAVDDEGPGIAEAEAAHLFEPFFSTKEDGTGLGLNVTRDVAIEHGGTAGYEPRPGGGSRFYIRLALDR